MPKSLRSPEKMVQVDLIPRNYVLIAGCFSIFLARLLVSLPSIEEFLETPDLLETPGGGGKMKISQTS